MSSTNRGYDRHAVDYYVTPKNVISDFCNNFDISSERFLDPCAGGDENHGMSYVEVLENFYPESIVHSLDVRKDSLAGIKEDYLNFEVKKEFYDCIITNPPFYLAKEIIEKALSDVARGGLVVMLLRLNFFGSNTRFPFFQKQLPTHCFVHHRRMSFTDDGKTDSIEYCHMVWKKDTFPEFTKLKII